MLRRDFQPPSPPKRVLRLRKVRNALIAVVAATLVALIGAEFLLRLVLFHPKFVPGEFGQSLRNAALFSDGDDDEEYWKLNFRFSGRSIDKDAPNPDPVTGYTGYDITPGTYAHGYEASIGERRPVLMFGDSFAQCMTPPDACFRAFLERSELSGQFSLLNFACGGYGLDQIYLLLKHSIDRYASRNPVVIVGILVDSDLDRSVMGFRDWPKPRLDVVGDRLVSRGPVQTSVRDYMAQHPISIRSYLWRLFLRNDSSFMAEQRSRWRGGDKIQMEKQILNRRILQEIERELSSRNLEHFFLVFHSESGALKRWDRFAWAEKTIEDVCAQMAIPLLDTRAFLSFASDGNPQECAKFYGHDSPLLGHHNALGNRICFEAIRQGLRRNYGPPDPRNLSILKERWRAGAIDEEVFARSFLGHDAVLIAQGGMRAPRAAETATPPRLMLRADPSGPTMLKFELAGGSKRFAGTLRTMAGDAEGCPAEGLVLAVEIDGEIVLECPVPPAEHARALEFDLRGKQSLSLIVSGSRGPGPCSWICLADPLLE